MPNNQNNQNTNQQPVKNYPQNRVPAQKPSSIPTKVIRENYNPLPRRGS